MRSRERQRQVVHRDHLELIQCVVCQRWFAVRVSSVDLQRHYFDGVFAQDAFPYLSPEYRELFITGCWSLLEPLMPRFADRLQLRPHQTRAQGGAEKRGTQCTALIATRLR
jgi:hypothetical protein